MGRDLAQLSCDGWQRTAISCADVRSCRPPEKWLRGRPGGGFLAAAVPASPPSRCLTWRPGPLCLLEG
jgi:hypothetical protein